MIALAWMDEEIFWPRRYSRRPKITDSNKNKKVASEEFLSTLKTRSVTSSSTATSTPKNCKTLNQTSLSNGNFDTRLILSDDCTHLPAPASSKHSKCQLHRWSEKRTGKQIAYCSDCNVCLCIQCYKAFHMLLDLQCVKNDLENDKDICMIVRTTRSEESIFSEMTPLN